MAPARGISYSAGAAAAAGTLLIINHNKQVHQKYADDARRQADAESQAQHAQAAYAAEKRAYANEVALNGEYKHEVATQHSMIESLRRQVALEQSRSRATASRPATAPRNVPPASVTRPAATGVVKGASSHEQPINVAAASWGWGQL